MLIIMLRAGAAVAGDGAASRYGFSYGSNKMMWLWLLNTGINHIPVIPVMYGIELE
jgi:hypothetical protein